MATGGLYGNSNNAILSYFTWFVFQQAASQPSTPTGGTWNFQTNIGVPPSGWSNSPAIPTTLVWMSMAIVSSQNSTITWSSPTPWSGVAGVFSYPAAGIPSSTGAAWGTTYTTSGSGIVLALATSPSIATPTFTGTITASQTTGAITYGALTYSDINNLATFQTSQNSYVQMVVQNSNSGATASTNLNVSNNNATTTTNFGEFGINSSGFTGTGAFNQAGYTYLASASTDLAIGTYSNNNIHFVVNSAATDVATISSAGLVVNTGYAFSTPSIAGMTTPLSVGQGGTGANAGPAALTNLGAAASGANSDITSLSAIASINAGPLFGNRIKNANKLIAQRGTSATVTAGTTVPTASTGYPTVDRFYGYCTGANVTVAQIAGSDLTNKRVQYTGAASVTAIGHGTRLEASETAHMAGATAIYSVELANSLLTTVTWAAYYATSTDTFGTVGTPTKTQIATGTFTVNSSVTKYSTQIALPAGATTGIEIVLTVGAQISGTWTIGREDFRLGSVSPTVWEVPSYNQALADCLRYTPSWYADANGKTFGSGQAYSATTGAIFLPTPVASRVNATGITGITSTGTFSVIAAAGSGVATSTVTFGSATTSGLVLSFTTAAGMVAGNATSLIATTAGITLLATGCEIP